MSDGTEFSEVSKVPEIRETPEVAEARQSLDRATLEPEAAVERSADIKTAEAVEAAVKETVDAVAVRTTESAAVSAANGGSETGDRESAAVAVTEDRGPRTEESAGAADAATGDRVEAPAPTGDGGKAYELRSDIQTGAQAVVERIESVESTRVNPPESAETDLQPERAEAVQIREGEAAASPGEAESAEVQRGDVPQETVAPSLGVEAAEDGGERAAASPQITGSGAYTGMGLPLDENQEGAGQDAAPIGIQQQSQETLRESYLDAEGDLSNQADKVRFINTQKEDVRSYNEDFRDTPQSEEISLDTTATPLTLSKSLADHEVMNGEEGSLTIEAVLSGEVLGGDDIYDPDTEVNDDAEPTLKPSYWSEGQWHSHYLQLIKESQAAINSLENTIANWPESEDELQQVTVYWLNVAGYDPPPELVSMSTQVNKNMAEAYLETLKTDLNRMRNQGFSGFMDNIFGDSPPYGSLSEVAGG